MILTPIELHQLWASYVENKADLRSLTLVCSTFRQVAQRSLFSRIEISGMGKHQPTKKEKTKLRQVKDRVKALQASDLRTHVKSIVLRNWSSGNTDTTAWEVTEAIYSSIMRFTAVSTVVCQDLLMKSTHLQSVLSLPNLRRIESVRCLFPFDTIGHALEEVVVIAPWVPAIPQDQALASGITTFLTSGSLKILDLRAICAVPYLIPMLDGSSPFNRLTRIRLSLPSDRPWSIISPLLALCPVLEELMVERVAAITTTGSALSPASCLPVVHTGAADVEFYQFNRPMDSGIVVATELLQPHDTISNITLRNVFDYRLFSEADVSEQVSSRMDIHDLLREVHEATTTLPRLKRFGFLQDIQLAQGPDSNQLKPDSILQTALELFPNLRSLTLGNGSDDFGRMSLS